MGRALRLSPNYFTPLHFLTAFWSRSMAQAHQFNPLSGVRALGFLMRFISKPMTVSLRFESQWSGTLTIQMPTAYDHVHPQINASSLWYLRSRYSHPNSSSSHLHPQISTQWSTKHHHRSPKNIDTSFTKFISTIQSPGNMISWNKLRHITQRHIHLLC